MLENILGSKSKIRMLRVLTVNMKREFCLEDVVKATGMSFGTVHPALKDLVSSRIVLGRKAGRSILYKINVNHVLFHRIKELVEMEKNGYIRIAKIFSKDVSKDDINAIILFGSVARGDFSERSDVDVLVVYRGKAPKGNVSKVINQILDEFDVQVVPTYITSEEVKQRLEKFDKFIVNVVEEGVVLYGDAKWLRK